MRSLQQFLIVAGAFVLAYNGSMLVHELGHAAAVRGTGGHVQSISISPLTWSVTKYQAVPELRAATWGGFLFGTGVPLVAFLALWCLKSRLSFWALMLAVVALMSNGAYLLVGAATGTGDAATLLKMGTSIRTLYIAGAAMVAAALPLALPAGALLGIGRGRAGFEKTLMVLGLPIFLYLLTIVAFNLLLSSGEWRTWTTAIGAGSALALALATVVHLAAGVVDGDETRCRAVPLGWAAAIGSLLAGAAVIVLELLLFC